MNAPTSRYGTRLFSARVYRLSREMSAAHAAWGVGQMMRKSVILIHRALAAYVDRTCPY